MKKTIHILAILVLFQNCADSDSEPPTPDVVSAPSITGLIVDDITNNGNGSDASPSISMERYHKLDEVSTNHLSSLFLQGN